MSVRLFKATMEKLDFHPKLKLNSKRFCPTKSVKYLSIKIDDNLTWIHHVNDTTKLNTTNSILFKGVVL